MQNGVFPAISINKDVTAISYSSLPNMNFWAQRTPRKNKACYPMAIELLALLASTEELSEMWKEAGHWPHIAKIHTKGMISVSQEILHLPIHIKSLNSLIWDIWTSLINNNLLMFELHAPSCKLLYNLTSLPTPSFHGPLLSGLLEILYPRLEVLNITIE